MMKRPASASPTSYSNTNNNNNQFNYSTPTTPPMTPQPHLHNHNNQQQHHHHHHTRTQSQSLTEYPNSESGGDRSSTIGGRSSIVGKQSRGGGGGGGGRYSTIGSNIGRNTTITGGTTSSIGNNNNKNRVGYAGSSMIGRNNSSNHNRPSSSSNNRHQQQLQQLFEPGGAGAARRALLYDMERHKLETLPLTRLFRFLADSPHWFTDASGTSSNYGGSTTDGGGKTNNNNSSSKGHSSHPHHHAMIKNLVVASPEGGRHVSKRQRDIDRARLASVLADKQDDLIIPDTIVWEASIPRGWFYTSFDGTDGRATVQRRSVDIGTIEKQWTDGLPPHAVAAAYYTIAERDPAASLADRDTPLLQFQFLRACELSKFLHVQATQTSGSDCAAILQQFTYPLHAHNVVIQAVWSPRVLNITIRQNVNALHDDRLDANTRACTFEGSPHLSLELRPTTRLYGQVESAINSLTKHFAAVDLKNRIVRIVAYFKVDKESRLNLLYVPSIRVIRTALIERPIGMRSSPFFSSFRVALDFAVEYETLTTDTRAWAAPSSTSTSGGNNNNNNKNSSSSHHDSNQQDYSPTSGGGSTLLLGGGGSRIRKSASNNNKKNSSNDGHTNKRTETGEGSRLLSDALDKALSELNIDRHSQAEAMARSHQKSRNNNTTTTISSSSNQGGIISIMSNNNDTVSNNSFSNENRSITSNEKNNTNNNIAMMMEEEDSIQYQLSHSPVIGQQRAELVEVVMEIVRASRTGKQASSAVTRAYRHAATPTARDALKWAAIEAGMICRDDDGFSHPFFEVSPNLLDLMKLICEDYREDLEPTSTNNNNKTDEKSSGGKITTNSNTNSNNNSPSSKSPSHQRELSNSSASQYQIQFQHSFEHFNSHHDLGLSMNSDHSKKSGGGGSILISPRGGGAASSQQSQSLQQSGNPLFANTLSPNEHLQHQNSSHQNNVLGSPFASLINLNQQSTTNHSHLTSPLSASFNNNNNSTNPQIQSWKFYSQQLRSGVSDFVYELVDSGIPSSSCGIATDGSSSSSASSPQDYSAILGSISREASQVCEIVLETCKSAATTAFENDHTHPSIQRSLPLAIGHLWKDVSVRDAVAILSCAVFGLMYIPTASSSSASFGGDNTKSNKTNSKNDFYTQLREKERLEKEKEKERRRQQFLKEQEQQLLLLNSPSSTTAPADPTKLNSNTSFSSASSPAGATSAATKSSTATFDKQEDVSMYYEGLSSVNANNNLSSPPTTEVILKTEETEAVSFYSLEVSVKNTTSLSLECQVRKFLGDVLNALERSPIDLLLPEIIEERKKLEQQQQQKNNKNKNNRNDESGSGSGSVAVPVNIKRRRPSHSVVENNNNSSHNNVFNGGAITSPFSKSPLNNHNNLGNSTGRLSSSSRNRSQTMVVTNSGGNNHNINNQRRGSRGSSNNNNSPISPFGGTGAAVAANNNNNSSSASQLVAMSPLLPSTQNNNNNSGGISLHQQLLNATKGISGKNRTAVSSSSSSDDDFEEED